MNLIDPKTIQKVLGNSPQINRKWSRKKTEMLPYSLIALNNGTVATLFTGKNYLLSQRCPTYRLKLGQIDGKWCVVRITKDAPRKDMMCGTISILKTMGLFKGDACIGDKLYHVVEYLPGITLAKLLAERKSLPLFVQLRICISLLQEIRKLYEKGFVHGDVKPSNIIYDAISQTVKLIDPLGCMEKVSSEYSVPQKTAKNTLEKKSDIATNNENSAYDFYAAARIIGTLLSFCKLKGLYRSSCLQTWEEIPREKSDHLDTVFSLYQKLKTEPTEYHLKISGEMIETLLLLSEKEEKAAAPLNALPSLRKQLTGTFTAAKRSLDVLASMPILFPENKDDIFNEALSTVTAIRLLDKENYPFVDGSCYAISAIYSQPSEDEFNCGPRTKVERFFKLTDDGSLRNLNDFSLCYKFTLLNNKRLTIESVATETLSVNRNIAHILTVLKKDVKEMESGVSFSL